MFANLDSSPLFDVSALKFSHGRAGIELGLKHIAERNIFHTPPSLKNFLKNIWKIHTYFSK